VAVVSISQSPEVHFLPSRPETQLAHARRLRAESHQFWLESLTIYCDLNLTMVAFGHANRDNERIRKLCGLTAVDAYRSIWRRLSKERRIEVQPMGLLAKLDQLRTAIIGLLGDKPWPTNPAPNMAITTPASRISIPTTARGPREGPFEDLTGRESEVLKLIAEGNSTKQIAAILGISFRTASSHRYRLMDKLGIHDTATLVRYAIRNDIVKA
jgi:DNA-binding CsgD family transcriptional regulator